MVTEIARQVTEGDIDRAVDLAALAWKSGADVDELPVPEAVERIDAAVEIARQEVEAWMQSHDQPDDSAPTPEPT